MASICVFCGSCAGNTEKYADAARDLGKLLAAGNHTLIYGGGSVGLMGILADQMLAEGGNVVGVIPQALANVELMHPNVTEMRVVADMHIRKATMHQLADAYIALPGGFGTLEELFEVLCWGQLEFHFSPVAILNSAGFFDGLLTQLKHMVSEGFLSTSHMEILYAATGVDEVQAWLGQCFSATEN